MENIFIKFCNLGIKWEPGNWAYGCDSEDGIDLINKNTESRLCGPNCEQNSDCSHFTYNLTSGMCQMKSGNISKSDFFYTGDKSQICGFVTDHVISNNIKIIIIIGICISLVIVTLIISITVFISNI